MSACLLNRISQLPDELLFEIFKYLPRSHVPPAAFDSIYFNNRWKPLHQTTKKILLFADGAHHTPFADTSDEIKEEDEAEGVQYEYCRHIEYEDGRQVGYKQYRIIDYRDFDDDEEEERIQLISTLTAEERDSIVYYIEGTNQTFYYTYSPPKLGDIAVHTYIDNDVFTTVTSLNKKGDTCGSQHYKNGERHGVQISDSDGNKTIFNHDSGELHGEQLQYLDNILVRQEHYDHGQLIDRRDWGVKGNFMMFTHCDPATRTVTRTYGDEYQFRDGSAYPRFFLDL